MYHGLDYSWQNEEAMQAWRVLDNLIADGAVGGPSGNAMARFRSLTPSQRELMLVDL